MANPSYFAIVVKGDSKRCLYIPSEGNDVQMKKFQKLLDRADTETDPIYRIIPGVFSGDQIEEQKKIFGEISHIKLAGYFHCPETPHASVECCMFSQPVRTRKRKASREYVHLTEHNDWESETWHFFIPVDRNGKQLEEFQRLVDGKNDSNSYDEGSPSIYTIDTSIRVPEMVVDYLVKYCNAFTNYMDAFHKLDGVLEVPESLDDIYKGGIRDYVSNKK